MKNVILSLALLLAINSFSQDSKHPIDVQNANCHDTAVPTTLGSINCELEAVKAWKVEMDSILLLLKAKEDLLDIALLEETQVKWVAFHESNVQFYHSYYQMSYQGGTMARVATVSYEKQQLRERTLYLKDFYEELE